MEQQLQFYLAQRKVLVAFGYLNFVSSWDLETEAAPGSIESASRQMTVFSEMEYRLVTDPQYIAAVDVLYDNRAQLEPILAHEIEVQRKSIDEMRKIPMEEYVAFRELCTNASAIYVEAKTTSDYSKFLPTLEKIIEFVRRQMDYLATDDVKGYNVLLDAYEPFFTEEKYDTFFALLKEKIVPFAKKVTAKQLPYDFSWAEKSFDIEKQRQFSEYLRDVLCFDKSRGIMKVSEHPFTNGFGTDDVRITTHFYENDVTSAIFSTLHETGHALYMQQCAPELGDTFSDDGASMGMHESQSRFYENIIGRSREFWEVHYPKLVEFFPEQLKGVTVDNFVAFVNRAENSFIRIEADELTYPLHIMLRYDIEKRVVSGELAAKDLPAVWNAKMQEYFGITPPTDKQGVLQDIHWAGGSFGYFPTYALGSAIGCQLFAAMNKDFDVLGSLKSGNTQQINDWLREKIHKYGATKYPMDILRDATGEDFDAKYFIEYLIDKYSRLYNI